MNILITRPEPEASELRALLEQDSIKATVLPLLDIRFLNRSGSVEALSEGSKEDELIFVSKNAVTAYPYAPSDKPCFAVGQSTALQLTKAGFSEVIYPVAGEGAEALLAVAELQQVKGRRFKIICGVDSRELLEKTLKQRGAKVSHLIAYQTHFRALNAEDTALLMHDYDLIVVTSSHALRHLAKLALAHNSNLFNLPVTVLAGNMLQSALQLGFKQPLTVPSFQNESLRHQRPRTDSGQ